MDYLRSLVVAGLLAVGNAHAAYATLTPPPGWVAGGGAVVAGPGGSYAAQTTANQWISNASRSSAMLNVGGKQQAINVSMKLAPNAGRVAAAFLFANPYVRAGVGIATWLGVAGVVWDQVNQRWTSPEQGSEVSTGYEYGQNGAVGWHSTIESACGEHVRIGAISDLAIGWIRTLESAVGVICRYKQMRISDGYTGYSQTNMQSRISQCPSGWYVTPAGCVQTPPPKHLTEKEMVDLLNPDNTPGWPSPSVPGEFPLGTPFPIDIPVINPDTGVNPFPKPLFVPTGQPVPNPKYNPDAPAGPGNQPWKQPGTTVTPRPTPGNPWQVDVQPTDREQGGPVPLPDTELNPDPNPDTDKPKPEEQQSLCEKHPDILACEKLKLGDLNAEPLPKNTVPLTITREEGFGPASGACPAPKAFVIMGKPMAFRWDLLCDFASQIRPLLVGFAYLSAALAFMGLSRKD